MKMVQIWTFRARESDYVAISKADLCSGCSSTCSNNFHTLRCQDVGGTRSDDVHTAASFQHPSSGRLQWILGVKSEEIPASCWFYGWFILFPSSPISCPNFKFQHNPVPPCLPKNKGNTLIRFGYNRIEQGKAAYQQRPWVFRWSRYIRMNISQQWVCLEFFFLNQNVKIQNLEKYHQIRNKIAASR